MYWFIFALLSAFCNSFSNILDKKYITGTGKHPIGYAFFRTVFATLSYSVFFLFAYFFTRIWFTGNFVLYAIICGAVTAFSGIFYYYALKLSNVSKIAPILRSRIVFVLALSVILLGEVPTLSDILGACLVIVGTYLVILEKGIKIRLDKAVLFALLNVGAASSLFIITKLASSLGDAFSYNLISILVMLAFRTLIVSFRLPEFRETYRILSEKNQKRWIALSSFSSSLKIVFLFLAFSEAQAFAVTPIQQSGTFFTVIFAYFLLHEKVTKKRAAGVVAILLGLLFVSLW